MKVDIPNGNLVSNSQMFFEVGSSLSYVCDQNYSTRDEIETQCQNDFTWSLDDSPFPICIRSKFAILN